MWWSEGECGVRSIAECGGVLWSAGGCCGVRGGGCCGVKWNGVVVGWLFCWLVGWFFG